MKVTPYEELNDWNARSEYCTCALLATLNCTQEAQHSVACITVGGVGKPYNSTTRDLMYLRAPLLAHPCLRTKGFTAEHVDWNEVELQVSCVIVVSLKFRALEHDPLKPKARREALTT